MTGLDTNVLVRYLTRDDERQYAVAAAAIDAAIARGDRLFVCIPVLLETMWVLERAYGADRASLALVPSRLLGAADFVVERESVVEAALAFFQSGRADFADCLIAAVNRVAGCVETLTFDRKAAALEGFRALPASRFAAPTPAR